MIFAPLGMRPFKSMDFPKTEILGLSYLVPRDIKHSNS